MSYPQQSSSRILDSNIIKLELVNSLCTLDLFIVNVSPSRTIGIYGYPIANNSNCVTLPRQSLSLQSTPIHIRYNKSRETTNLLAGESFSVIVDFEFPKTELVDVEISIGFDL